MSGSDVLGRLSFRYKLPLALTITAVFTALVVGAVMLAYAYVNTRASLIDHAESLAAALVATARPALRNDDVWRAYTMLSGRTLDANEPGSKRILLDDDYTVFASNRPDRFSVGRTLEADGEFAELGGWIQAQGVPDEPVVVQRGLLDTHLVLVAPVLSEQIAVGALVIAYPRSQLIAGFWQLVAQGGLAIAVILAILLPVGWYLGHRIASPLSQVADTLSRFGERRPEQISYFQPAPSDEIGRLLEAFNEMLAALREKAALERQVIASERLAALGRLTATVAHEVNNPLGGMLISVDTLRRREPDNPHVQHTGALLERGLGQIRQTVSALLVQGRMEDRDLDPSDVEDVRTLVSSRLDRRQARLEWDAEIPSSLPVPATAMRQVLINLLLNAIDALDEGGDWVRFRMERGLEHLDVTVDNNGRAIPAEYLDRIFEPFTGMRAEGTGMGLWVTYQLVEGLGGQIEAHSNNGSTRFRVSIPLPSDQEQAINERN